MKGNKIEKYTSILSSSPNNWKVARDLLHYLRVNKQRRSDLIVKYGKPLLSNHASGLGDEVWDVYEQVFIAALDCAEYTLAKEYLNKLKAKFVRSSRVQRLKGMLCEAQGNWADADAIYSKIIQDDPTDSITMKRQITVHKGRGDTKLAVALLKMYLEIWMADTEAWAELASLHISLQQYKEAAYCYEELILAAPQNFLLYLKYAEILYTLGGLENFKLARKYFAYSYELNDKTNVRALWGISACNLAIATAKGGKQYKEEGQELTNLANRKLKEMYKQSDKSSIVQGVLQKLSI